MLSFFVLWGEREQMEKSLKNFINEDLEVKHLKIGECIFTNSPIGHQYGTRVPA